MLLQQHQKDGACYLEFCWWRRPCAPNEITRLVWELSSLRYPSPFGNAKETRIVSSQFHFSVHTHTRTLCHPPEFQSIMHTHHTTQHMMAVKKIHLFQMRHAYHAQDIWKRAHARTKISPISMASLLKKLCLRSPLFPTSGLWAYRLGGHQNWA